MRTLTYLHTLSRIPRIPCSIRCLSSYSSINLNRRPSIFSSPARSRTIPIISTNEHSIDTLSILTNNNYSNLINNNNNNNNNNDDNNNDNNSDYNQSNNNSNHHFNTPHRLLYITFPSALLIGYLFLFSTSTPIHCESSTVHIPSIEQTTESKILTEVETIIIDSENMITRFFQRLSLILYITFRIPYLSLIWLPLFCWYPILPYNYWLQWFILNLQLSGPVFIKFGQWASTRPDLFSQSFINSLSTLQSSVNPHSYKHTMKIFKKYFPNYSSNLSISKELIGSGSMAQVHYGQLQISNNQSIEVAIKILHPRTKQKIYIDCYLLNLFAKCVDCIPYAELKWLSLPEAVKQFESLIIKHADLNIEAENLIRFENNFKHSNKIRFPKVIKQYVNNEILVETYEKGCQLNEFLKLNDKKEEEDNEITVNNIVDSDDKYWLDHTNQLANLGMKMFLQMMINDNFIHSDLHPGNILVTTKQCISKQPITNNENNEIVDTTNTTNTINTTEFQDINNLLHDPKGFTISKPTLSQLLLTDPSELELIILDAGLVTELNQHNRENFLSLFGAIVEGDGILAAQLMRDNAREQHVVDNELYEKEMSSLVGALPDLTMNKTSIGLLLQKVMNVVRKHHVKIESDFANLVMSIIILEGIGKKLNPNLSLFQESIPMLMKNDEARKILWNKCGFKLFNSMTIKAGLQAYFHPGKYQV